MMALRGSPADRQLAPAGPRAAASTPRSSTPIRGGRPSRGQGDLRAVPGPGGVPRARAHRPREARRLGRSHRAGAPPGPPPASPLGLTRPPPLPSPACRARSRARRRAWRPPPDPRAAVVAVGRGGAAVATARRGTASTPSPAGAGPAHVASSPATPSSLASAPAPSGGYAVHRARRVFASAERREELDREHEIRTRPSRSRAELGNMKGALMKLGQMVSYLDEGLPEHVRDRAGAAPARRAADERRARRVDGRAGARPPARGAVRRVGPGADRGRVDRPGAPGDHPRRASRSR